MDTFFLNLFVAIPIIIWFVAIYFLLKYYDQYKRISKTETSRIGFLRNGYHEVKGKIVSLNENLISPLSKKSCVYYHLLVQERKSSGKSNSWVTIIDDEKYRKFAIDDGSGQVIIDLDNAELKFKIDKDLNSNSWNRTTQQMHETLQKYDKSSTGWIFEKTLEYQEIFLEEGDPLYVLGEVDQFENFKPVFRKNAQPLLVSDKSEEGFLKDLKTKLAIGVLVFITMPIIELIILYKNQIIE